MNVRARPVGVGRGKFQACSLGFARTNHCALAVGAAVVQETYLVGCRHGKTTP